MYIFVSYIILSFEIVRFPYHHTFEIKPIRSYKILCFGNIFLILSGLILTTIILVVLIIPSWDKTETPIEDKGFSNYKTIWTHPYFLSLVPLGFFNYGGLQAIQTLWAGPWMTNVSGYTSFEAALNFLSKYFCHEVRQSPY